MMNKKSTNIYKSWNFLIQLWLIGTLPFLVADYADDIKDDPLTGVERWKIDTNPNNPTPEEMTRAVTIKGAPGWGFQMRRENCVRLLCIGGSQTAEAKPTSIVPVLDLWLKKYVSPSSYALNRGRGSTMPAAFVGIKYDWEDWETSKWPNVIMIDFTLNTLVTDGWKCVKDVDKVIRGIKQKYTVKNLPYPDVYLLELALIYGFYADSRTNPHMSREQAIQRYNNLSSDPADVFFAGNGFDRGCVNCAYFNSLAQFYGYPVVSFREAAWPAFLRHHIAHPNTLWSLSIDAIHLSLWGRFFLQNYILGPFFNRTMAPRETDTTYQMPSKYSHYYEHDLRMFAPELTVKEVARWQCWGNEKNTLRSIISISVPNNRPDRDHSIHTDQETKEIKRNNWHFTTTPGHKHDKGHVCYGSRKLGTTTVFNIEAPVDCDSSVPCVLQLSSIFSWNSTHFGSMDCSLFRNETKSSGGGSSGNNMATTIGETQRLVTRLSIGSQVHNGVTIRNTLPLETTVSESVRSGTYHLSCTKTDGKKSCVTAVRLHQEFIF